MNATKPFINTLVEMELKAANKVNPPFHSAHEGYAVILEEVDEVNMEMMKLDEALNNLWEVVKANKWHGAKTQAIALRYVAGNLASEAIQVAAMCDKLLAYYGGT